MAVEIFRLGMEVAHAFRKRMEAAQTPARIISRDIIDQIMRGVIDPQKLVDYIAEALTCKPKEAREIIVAAGFADVIGESFTVPPENIRAFAARIIYVATEKFGTGTKTLLGEGVPIEAKLKRIDSALRNTFDNARLIDELAAAMQGTKAEAAEVLKEVGALDIAAAGFSVPAIVTASKSGDEMVRFQLLDEGRHLDQAIPGVTVALSQTGFMVPRSMVGPLQELFAALPALVEADSLPPLYREGIMGYHAGFERYLAPPIDGYLGGRFSSGGLQFVVNSGIGGNEQPNHALARLYNATREPGAPVWVMANSPAEFVAFLSGNRELAAQMAAKNTLFMEFSRSGKTEETALLHEFTDPATPRIVFANAGKLRELAERDGNLRFDLPDDVSGRFGFVKTPITWAPMRVLGMDTAQHWQALASAASGFDFSSPGSLPALLAKFIYLTQRSKPGTNQIYFGATGSVLGASADSLIQFWMEGVNKATNLGETNDLAMTRYLGLPRDSHLTLEGVLANAATKLGIFLLDSREVTLQHPLLRHDIAAVDPKHAGMRLGREDFALAGANVERFKEKGIPVILAQVDDLTTDSLAGLNMLWADTTLAYAKLLNIDPGSNPEVKFVRDRAAEALVAAAQGTYDLLSKLYI